MTEPRAIEICADWVGLGGPRVLGTLHATPSRGRELFAFEYAASWLEHGDGRLLDPNLVISRGRQYTRPGHDNFGVFLDSCPDRWGRVLMRRREARDARRSRRPERTLLESDYLLGVFDRHRMGALRFRAHAGGPFVDATPGLAAPPWTSLRALEEATRALERDDAQDDPAYDQWLALLLAPGASLGGARPKADVVDPGGRLWIAKFPSVADTHDVGAWEHVVHALARGAGIDVPEARVERFASKQHTFLVQRFDRTHGEQRVHFASALTLLGRSDGDDATAGASYLDLATLIERHGARPTQDLEQLWRRIVLSVCVSNVDDHLRNHGFILGDAGWALSPAYDMNPSATGDGLRLNISETDNAQDLELVREVAPFFRIKRSRVDTVLAEVRDAASKWRVVASDGGLSRAAQDRMARAFRLADAG